MTGFQRGDPRARLAGSKGGRALRKTGVRRTLEYTKGYVSGYAQGFRRGVTRAVEVRRAGTRGPQG